MISWKELYNVLANVVPLYVVLILAYGSVKWWKIFTPHECSGINKFVALFAVPLLSIKFMSNNNPYATNFRFVAADSLQKLVLLVILFLWCKLSSRGSLEWCITLFSLSTLPNTIVVGIPLLGGMYGEEISQSLMVQLSVFQLNIWFPVLLFLYEYRRTTLLFPKHEENETCTTTTTTTNNNSSSLVECSNDENYYYCNNNEGTLDELFDGRNKMGIDVVQSGSTKMISDHHKVNTTSLTTGSAVSPETSSTSKVEVRVETAAKSEQKSANTQPAARSVVTARLILVMVCKKLMRNPNFYSCLVALTWSLISFRWQVKMPSMVANSIKIISDTGLGMAMFSLGLFMASQPNIISGGCALAALAAAMRFIVAPTITAATSYAIGLRGTLLQITIMQAALPQSIISFVFAQEYNVHPGILSTAVSFGMLISLPITLAYYIILGVSIK